MPATLNPNQQCHVPGQVPVQHGRGTLFLEIDAWTQNYITGLGFRVYGLGIR